MTKIFNSSFNNIQVGDANVQPMPALVSEPGHAFACLTPDFVMDALTSKGYICDGRMLALNSYENRVYQVGIEDDVPIIAKFYRPLRWSKAQILEEQHFCFELAEQDLSVVCPLRDDSGDTLFVYRDMQFSLFSRKGGRAPEIDNLDSLNTIGTVLGQIHQAGAARPFTNRPALTIKSFGESSREFLLNHLLPKELRAAYDSTTSALLKKIEEKFSYCSTVQWIRCHGDCHIGNMLWRDDVPHFVDFDDARMAPAIQDLWMLLSGDRFMQQQQLEEVIDGYEMFRSFDAKELHLIEALRTLRIVHYAAWLGRRWHDPAFPMHFPWFNTERYWGEHILELKEQLSLLDEPVLLLGQGF